MIALFGKLDANVAYMRDLFGVRIVAADGGIRISGDDEANLDVAVKTVSLLLEKSKTHTIDKPYIDMAAACVRHGCEHKIDDLTRVIAYTAAGKPVRAKTYGQACYVRSIERNTVVFGIGPAGTGKTYLAVALAYNALRDRQVSRIILARPAVEAGEKLGFLPGDLEAKVDPYLKPLNDALLEMMGADSFAKAQERGVVEVAPLAYMRGRTLSDSFIILDEAQNATREQMKMFLTRMGEGSKIVVTGDVTQVDLPSDKQSGLVHASRLLRGIDGIETVTLSSSDVVRHPLVQAIVRAYDAEAKGKES